MSEAETAMAEYLGAPFALGLNSGGSAIFLALKLAGVGETKTKIIGLTSGAGDGGQPSADQQLHAHPGPWRDSARWWSSCPRSSP